MESRITGPGEGEVAVDLLLLNKGLDGSFVCKRVIDREPLDDSVNTGSRSCDNAGRTLLES